jgi:hypothetical protein
VEQSAGYTRRPAVAGQFYPRGAVELGQQLSELIDLASFGFVVQGVVVPHAGYIYSGKVAGKVYGRVHIPNHVILLGPNHTGLGKRGSIAAAGEWELPIGKVPIESGLAELLLGATRLLEPDTEAHRQEHSLEVQVPFLHRLNPAVRIVPITLKVHSLEDCTALGQALADVVRGWPSPVLLVASTDMSHYEPRASAQAKDRLAIDQMLALSPEGLYQTVSQNHISMCGFIPTTVVLAACRSLGVSRVELVGYSDSGEASGDTQRVVGYAGLVLH